MPLLEAMKERKGREINLKQRKRRYGSEGSNRKSNVCVPGSNDKDVKMRKITRTVKLPANRNFKKYGPAGRR